MKVAPLPNRLITTGMIAIKRNFEPTLKDVLNGQLDA